MKKDLKLFFATLSVLFVTLNARADIKTYASRLEYAFASNTEHELVINPSQISVRAYKEAKNRTDIDLYVAYNHHIQEQIQVGAEGGFISGTDTNGNSKALIAAMGVFTYNFASNLREAFFAQAGLGLYPSYVKDDGDFESKVSFLAGFGKRFEIWGRINYMPQLRIWKRGDENARFELQLLNFSVFF